MNITPSGTHCWLCGFGPIPAGAAVCPCDICQSNYRRTGEYTGPKTRTVSIWRYSGGKKPEEKR